MDVEQIQKKLDWLDSERRQDKDLIASLEAKVENYQEDISKLNGRVVALEGELARALPVSEQLTVLEEKINNVRIDLTRSIEQSLETIHSHKEAEDADIAKRFLAFQSQVEDLRTELESVQVLEEELETRKDEEFKIRRMVAELEEKIEQNRHDDESWRRTITLLEEGRRKDANRLVELQAEYDNIRKRLEEQAGKVEVATENIRKFDKRIAELRLEETQRNQNMHTFTEQQSLKTMELERDWKKMQSNFEGFMGKFENFERKVSEISLLAQTLTTSQDTYEDNNERIEKRIHEITEMHRLNREQFLADWETFQGEEKHRWSQYMIEEEERRKDQERKATATAERLENLSNFSQEVADDVAQFKQDLHGYWRKLVEITKDLVPKG